MQFGGIGHSRGCRETDFVFDFRESWSSRMGYKIVKG